MSEERIAYIKEPRMTVSEIAKKYDEDAKVVRHVLAMAGVEPDGKRNKTYVYREIDAAEALIRMYRKRAEELRREAQKWTGYAEKVELTYEEGYEE